MLKGLTSFLYSIDPSPCSETYANKKYIRTVFGGGGLVNPEDQYLKNSACYWIQMEPKPILPTGVPLKGYTCRKGGYVKQVHNRHKVLNKPVT